MSSWRETNRDILKCNDIPDPGAKNLLVFKIFINKYGPDGMIYLHIGKVYEELKEYDKALEV